MRTRLDDIVAARESITRSQARGLILAGRVRVNGAPVTKAGAYITEEAVLEIQKSRRFVSRGGEKLNHALDAFNMNVQGATALDIGASTGGFTDCLLSRGAACVTALDVGYGQLAWKLRNDPRVTVIERTNFRNLPDDAFPGGFDVIAADTSFISLRTIIARAKALLRPAGSMAALVKPQFEAGRERIGGGGVVRDPEVHRAVLREVRSAVNDLGLRAVAVTASPLRGPAGNREFFLFIRHEGIPINDATIDSVVNSEA
ncbi:MAG: TlyA family rRNA (cytidine-2'-O)-methyltransferase [Candidatus Meridianibacter frigidus]|nr:MAG: TlyA family rRNA (cytidine-2'-O)-methyltransferase [Candidatus Eremiobacteraeota bacterium]